MNLSRIERFLFLITPNWILRRVLPLIPKFIFFRETINSQTPISFDVWYNQKIKGHARNVYWPVHSTSNVYNWKNIYCGIETCPGYSPGNYIQAVGKIYLGDYTQIGPNVGLISSNHDLYDNSLHIESHIKIGSYSWIGMNSIILPGVELGDFTIVGAGSVVTKSFKEGYCVIGGNPAKILKKLEPSLCKRNRSEFEYNGYISTKKFAHFRKENLNI